MQIALRTQQLIAYESGVAETVDPLAGSYYIESLTDNIEKGARSYIEQIDELGGSPRAIENGFIQREIQKSAYDYQKAIEANERVVVGINKFKVKEEPPTNILRVDPKVREEQMARLKTLKSERDSSRTTAALAELRATAKGEGNLMPSILEAVKAYATLGEICDVLRDVFGEYKPSTFF